MMLADLFAGQRGPVDGPADLVLRLGAADADDCAVISCQGDFDLVVGTDYVRGPKFMLHELGYLSLYDLGYYLVAANLSDVAAMGASPLGVLTVVRYPPGMTDAEFTEVMTGIRDSAAAHGTLNIGGDIGGAERLILSATALGAAPVGRAMTRSNGSAGDVLYVTGPVGDAGAAVLYFSKLKPAGKSLDDDVEAELLRPWRRPQARLGAGAALARQDLATACQDISDGLRATVDELAAASHVGAEVNLADVPIGRGARAVADLLDVDPCALAMSASVDFELLFCSPPDRCADVDAALAEAGVHPVAIGRLVVDPHIVGIRDGVPVPLPGVAWRHQSEDPESVVLPSLRDAAEANEPGLEG